MYVDLKTHLDLCMNTMYIHVFRGDLKGSPQIRDHVYIYHKQPRLQSLLRHGAFPRCGCIKYKGGASLNVNRDYQG